mmetsp:Transcript_11266/g.22679  ORF Transcript_11266/g.22679 Transcript_11266/m.22679 type:complete len:707 (-) Transcript_11266:2353-4473(-)
MDLQDELGNLSRIIRHICFGDSQGIFHARGEGNFGVEVLEIMLDLLGWAYPSMLCRSLCASPVERTRLTCRRREFSSPPTLFRCSAAESKVQNIDFTTLIAVVGELRRSLVPARFEVVFQEDATELTLGLRTLDRGRQWLTLSWHPSLGRVCLRQPLPKAAREDMNYTLSAFLRNSLNGMALVDVDIAAPFDRIVKLSWSTRPESPPELNLFLELQGAGKSNFVAVDSSDTIRICGRQVSERKANRPLQIGTAYQLHPPPTGVDPRSMLVFDEWNEFLQSMSGIPLGKALVRLFKGMSPSVANSMLVQGGVGPGEEWASMDISRTQKCFELWTQWVHSLDDSTLFRPQLVMTPDFSAYSVMGWLPDQDEREDMDSPSGVVDAYFRQLRRKSRFENLIRECSIELDKLLTRQRTRVQQFEQSLRRAEEAEDLRVRGDLFLSFAHTWSPDQPQVVIEDFDTGLVSTETILPPSNPIQEANKLHKTSRKLRRAVDKVRPLLTAGQDMLAYLSQIAQSMEDLKVDDMDFVVLREIRDEIREARKRILVSEGVDASRNLSPTSAQKDTKRKGSGKIKFKGVTSESNPLRIAVAGRDGEVLVGRNNRQNDRLSFQTARAGDLWFHAAGVPGAHVLLRTTNPDEASLQFAADIAAFCSSAGRSTQVLVCYTEPKHLRRAGAPGMVHVMRQKTLDGRPERAALVVQAARRNASA